MTEAHSICPEIKIPATFRPGIKELKIFIPQTASVSSNFVGMVLGPRGLTHKKLESQTGAKITIRSRDAQKKMKISPDSRSHYVLGLDEEAHIHIASSSWNNVDKAAQLVEPLLTNIQEEKNITKRAQMMKLASISGSKSSHYMGTSTTASLQSIELMMSPFNPDKSAGLQLPAHIAKKIELQYKRDVAATRKTTVQNTNVSFNQFYTAL
jgi:splicing factor 1